MMLAGSLRFKFRLSKFLQLMRFTSVKMYIISSLTQFLDYATKYIEVCTNFKEGGLQIVQCSKMYPHAGCYCFVLCN